MKQSKYAKTLAVAAIFLMRDMRINFLPKSESESRDLYGDAMLVPIRMGTNMAVGNQQKHLSLSFATKA